MIRRTGPLAPVPARSIGAVALVAAVALGAACSPDDGATPPTTVAVAPTVEPTTTVTVAPTTTVAPGPPLSDRLSLVEVSVLVAGPSTERVASMSAGGDVLSGIEDLGVDDTPVWCSAVDDATAPLVVRIGPPAAATGAIERFELVAATAPAGAPAGASITLVVDGVELTAEGTVQPVGTDVTSATFAATTADGTTVEGAYRCA